VIWLLDTNTIIHAMNGVAVVQMRLNEAWRTDRVVTSVLVRGELMYGAYGSHRREDNEKQIRAKLARFEVLPGGQYV
jgi:predicted nucleic acid-binding protein